MVFIGRKKRTKICHNDAHQIRFSLIKTENVISPRNRFCVNFIVLNIPTDATLPLLEALLFDLLRMISAVLGIVRGIVISLTEFKKRSNKILIKKTLWKKKISKRAINLPMENGSAKVDCVHPTQLIALEINFSCYNCYHSLETKRHDTSDPSYQLNQHQIGFHCLFWTSE